MASIERQLREYYEAEAAGRLRPRHGGRRDEFRSWFVDRLVGEGASTVVDVGAGPAVDGEAFVARRLRYVGVDLAVGNALLARERGLELVPASLFELPFAAASFDAGWSMSTLQHVPDDRFDAAVAEIVRVMRPGAPIGLGIWGGQELVVTSERSDSGLELPRHFTLRTHGRTRAMLARHGEIESFESFAPETSEWEYELAVLRVTG